MSNQVFDRRTVGIPGTVTPAVIAARDAAVEAAARAAALEGSASRSASTALQAEGTAVLAATDSVAAAERAEAAEGTFTAPANAVIAGMAKDPGPLNDALTAAISIRRSPVDQLADTERTRYISYQKQERENRFNGGEVLWFDTAPLAKSMLTWRLPIEGWATRKVLGAHDGPFPDSAWQRIVWAGAHWFAQDQPDDANPTVIHGHWSVETPTPDGQLHTRFQIFFNDRVDPSKVGSEIALISTNRADFLVERQSSGGEVGGRFILAGSHTLDRMVEFSRNNENAANRRWAAGVTGQAESGSNGGANFAIRRHSDEGTVLGTALFIQRDSGRITLGSADTSPLTQPSTVLVAGPGGTDSGILVKPGAAFTTGAAFNARLLAWNDTLLRSQIGSAAARFEVSAYGRLKWGDGVAAPVIEMYVENGALMFKGSNGTITKIASS